MIMVTGHDSISERSIAERFALLKSAQSALSPVSVTLTAPLESSSNRGARALAASTMVFVLAEDPATRITVRPFLEMVTPG
jgi:hypothetical protein